MKVAIVGGAGYTGIELFRLLCGHEEVEVVKITSDTYQGKKVHDVYQNFSGKSDLKFESYEPESIIKTADLVFLAVPHGKAMDYVPELVRSGVKVIDLSGDFRFKDAEIYETWYKMPHTAKGDLDKAVYGLPEINREAIKEAILVANPGCYPTASVLGLYPALRSGIIDVCGIVIDAKSGISGAGRTATETTHYARRAESMAAYSVTGHKHTPEIEAQLSAVSGKEVIVSFTPHLAPMTRGILATIYADMTESIPVEEIIRIYREAYEDEDFVHVLAPPVLPETAFVRGSNNTHISISVDDRTGKMIVISAIDNLVKGAAGQAIQNLNIMAGLPETKGLKNIGVYP